MVAFTDPRNWVVVDLTMPEMRFLGAKHWLAQGVGWRSQGLVQVVATAAAAAATAVVAVAVATAAVVTAAAAATAAATAVAVAAGHLVSRAGDWNL